MPFFFLDLILTCEKFPLSRGVCPAGINHVHPDALAQQLSGGCFSHHVEGGLGHVVGHARGRRHMSVGRTHQDNGSRRLPIDKVPRGGPKKVEGPPQRNIDGLSETLDVRLVKKFAVAVDRARHEDVDGAEGRDGLGEGRLGLVEVAEADLGHLGVLVEGGLGQREVELLLLGQLEGDARVLGGV